MNDDNANDHNAGARAARLLTVLGPTASGKTRLAVALARDLNGAIISADSRQIYRGMDIGTGKDIAEYGEVPYYLIDIKDPGEAYHVAAYRKDFLNALGAIRQAGKTPVLCGGTGLYIQAALQGLPFASVPVDPSLRQSLEATSTGALLDEFNKRSSAYSPLADTSTRKRLIRAIEIARYLEQYGLPPGASGAGTAIDPAFSAPGPGFPAPDLPALGPGSADPVVIGIRLPVEERRARITRRLRERLAAGLLVEVRDLLDRGVSAEQLLFYGLEYKFAVLYLQGELDEEQFFTRLNIAIHQFAKRQMTFFRKLEKDGLRIHWIDGTLPFAGQVAVAGEYYSQQQPGGAK